MTPAQIFSEAIRKVLLEQADKVQWECGDCGGSGQEGFLTVHHLHGGDDVNVPVDKRCPHCQPEVNRLRELAGKYEPHDWGTPTGMQIKSCLCGKSFKYKSYTEIRKHFELNNPTFTTVESIRQALEDCKMLDRFITWLIERYRNSDTGLLSDAAAEAIAKIGMDAKSLMENATEFMEGRG